MSETEKVHELFESFLAGFVQPLICGGIAQQTRALPASTLDYFSLSHSTDYEVEEAIARGMIALASELCPVDHLPFPERGAMATAMALHNLSTLTDPMLNRAMARSARPRILDWVDTLTESIRPPATRGEALVRHVLWSRFLHAKREDTVVKNWAYTYRFYGRPPPANVVALPKLRFVRQQHTQQSLPELLQDQPDLDLATRFRRLLTRSPITEILRGDLAPDLQFGVANLAVLSDLSLRHGVVQTLVKNGTGRIAAPLGHALRMLSVQDTPPHYLAVAIQFLAELQILEVLDARAGHQPRSEPAVGDEELFSGVLPALLAHQGPLRHLLNLNADDLEQVRDRAELRRKQSGDDAVAFAASILDRADLHSAAQPGAGSPAPMPESIAETLEPELR